MLYNIIFLKKLTSTIITLKVTYYRFTMYNILNYVHPIKINFISYKTSGVHVPVAGK